MVSGQWSVVSGQWSVVRGQRHFASVKLRLHRFDLVERGTSNVVAFNQIDSVRTLGRIRLRRNAAFDVVEFDVARSEHVLKFRLVESNCLVFNINLNQSVFTSGFAMDLIIME